MKTPSSKTTRWKSVAASAGIVAAASLILAGCAHGTSPASSTPSGHRSTVLTQVTSADPQTLNPDLPGAATDKMVGCMLYQGLTRVDSNYKAQPLLAKSWDISKDGTTYTFHLQQAKFTDGTPMTSKDVVYSLTQIAAKYSSTFAAAASSIDSVSAIDPQTVKISLKHPFGPLLASLSCDLGGAAILPQHVFEGTDVLKNPASTEKPVGTGAFTLKEGDWQRGSQLTLSKNPDYWKPGAPLLDKVVYKVIPTAGARTIAVLSHQLDYVYHYFTDTDGLVRLKNDKSVKLTDVGPPGDFDIILNNRKAPYSNVKVRQALLTAIDRDFLVKSVLKGFGAAAKSAISSQFGWAYNRDVNLNKTYAFNPTKAKTLLQQAGVKDLTVRLTFDSTKPAFPAMAQAISEYWKKIGVNVVLQGGESAVVNAQVFNKWDFDALLTGYSSLGDPALGLARKYVSSSIGHAVFNNASGYSNPEVDALFAEGANATSQKDRAVYYFKVQKILERDVPTLPLLEVGNEHVGVAGLHGMYSGIQQYGDWWDQVSLDK